MSVLFDPPPSHRFSSPPQRPNRPRSKPINIQDGFLFESLKEDRALVVALLTGKMIQCQIRRFDRYAIVVDDGNEETLLYKHAIACIARVSAR